MDFFTVSLTVPDLAKTFHRSNSDITWGIGLVLMLRIVGASIFGILSDRFGRKWPFIANNVLFIILELSTGFTQTYSQFLAVRALFGIAMGGLYANAIATGIEDCPKDARGIVSGILQQGYAFGYLLATVFARALVNTTSHGWRPLYWFCACPPVLLIIWRLSLPETSSFTERKILRGQTQSIEKTFMAEVKLSLQRYAMTMVYMALLMTGITFMVRNIRPLQKILNIYLYFRHTDLKTSTQQCFKISINSMPIGSPLPKLLQILVLYLEVQHVDTHLKLLDEGLRCWCYALPELL
jgi:SHS family lactate transporter-like MFS transporter